MLSYMYPKFFGLDFVRNIVTNSGVVVEGCNCLLNRGGGSTVPLNFSLPENFLKRVQISALEIPNFGGI